MAGIEPIVIPKWGMTTTEGKIVQWLVGEGAPVTRGQEILEIETSKVANAVESPATGILRRIVLPEGETSEVGTLIGVIAGADVPEEEIESFIAGAKQARAAEEPADEPREQVRTIQAGDLTLALIDGGDPASDEIAIFLHGFGGDKSNWLFNQPALTAELATMAIDLPGHGASTPPVGDDAVSGILTALETVVGRTNRRRVHMIGHSFGGYLAARIGERLGASLASLVLIAPVGLGASINQDYLREFLAAERRRPLAAALGQLFADPSKVSNEMVENTLALKRLDGVADALARLAGQIARDGKQLLSVADLLARLTCPVTIIWGAQDRIVARPDAVLRGTLTEHVIADAGHMPHIESPRAVNDLILGTLRSA